VVLAAGAGTRFGAEKQFRTVAGHRLVDLAVATAVEVCDRVVLVLPAHRRWDGPDVWSVVEGGVDRPASVRRGLAAIPDERGIVLVHQAANPLASVAMCHELVTTVRSGAPAVVPGLRPSDVVRRAEGGRAGALVGRDELVLVQTPAAFDLQVLRQAHTSTLPAVEDTALVSAIGHPVHLIPGDPSNVHVATAGDLELVRALLLARWVGSPAGLLGEQGDTADGND
jgi:2-C-methyl-D-erythritol 4-phosphate cytidylyltransferase